MMNRKEAKEFTSLWLPAWTGNQPDKLIRFYSEEAFYLDPVVPDGIQGKQALLLYFQKLLAKNPDWVWTNIDVFPMEKGFLNKWLARIPVGNQIIDCVGVCTVEIKEGIITRNEVYFDRSRLLNL